MFLVSLGILGVVPRALGAPGFERTSPQPIDSTSQRCDVLFVGCGLVRSNYLGAPRALGTTPKMPRLTKNMELEEKQASQHAGALY